MNYWWIDSVTATVPFLGNVYLGNTLISYLIYFFFIALAVLAGKLVTWLTKTFVKIFAEKSKTKMDDVLVSLLEGPVLLAIFVIAVKLSKKTLVFSESVGNFYTNIVSVLIMITIGWFIARFINGMIHFYIKPMTEKTETDLDDHLLPILNKLVNIFVIIIIVIMGIDKFGYNVGSLLAGLGIGGLAFALAAKDLVSNLFGGVAILVDKPFKIGDRIKVDEVDGFVREIGLRTTRVETFGGTMYTLPNSKVVDSVTENVSAEQQRRMTFTIGVEYDTSVAKLEEGKKIITKHLKKVSGIDHKDFAVSFSEFAASSLNIRVQYWITKKGMDDYWGVQDTLYTAIKKDFEKAKISMAFPTQTVHVKK